MSAVAYWPDLPACLIDGCDRPVRTRGWCENHYAKWRRTGSPMGAGRMRGFDAPTRFWAKVDRSGDCWLWVASRNAMGYGRFDAEADRRVFAHRYAYELEYGPIPPGLEMDHLCRNPACVNPAHLEAVTSQVNQQRRAAVITHCPSGHPYEGENLINRPDGRRGCRLCRRAAVAKSRRKRLANAG